MNNTPKKCQYNNKCTYKHEESYKVGDDPFAFTREVPEGMKITTSGTDTPLADEPIKEENCCKKCGTEIVENITLCNKCYTTDCVSTPIKDNEWEKHALAMEKLHEDLSGKCGVENWEKELQKVIMQINQNRTEDDESTNAYISIDQEEKIKSFISTLLTSEQRIKYEQCIYRRKCRK